MSENQDLDNRGDAKPRLSVADELLPYQDSAAVLREEHLSEYFKILHKRRYIGLTAWLVVVLAVVVYTFTAVPVFEARARLIIESDAPNVVSFKEVLEEGRIRSDYYQTQYNILQSRSLAKRTIDALNLWHRPAFVDPPKSFDPMRLVSAPIDWASRLAKRGSEPARASGESETEAQSAVINAFLSGLIVTPINNSRLVDIMYRSPDPDLATKVINALAAAYIERNLEFKFMSSKEASDWLGNQLAEQRKKVEVSEVALQSYREQNDAVSLNQRQDIVVQKLADLNGAVTKAKTERIEKEALFTQLRAMQNDRSALDTFPAILSNSFIQQQKTELAQLQRQLVQQSQQLGERHPDIIKVKTSIQQVDAKLQGEIGKIVQSVRNEYLSAQAQEQSLMAALETQKHEALLLDRRGIEYGVLRRDAESNRQIYESLLQRAKETGVSGELKTNNIRIVDPAERPSSPISPRKSLNMLFGIVAGLMLGVGFAFFAEYLDNRIKTPNEIRDYLGVPFLGIVPDVLPASELGEAPLLVSAGVPAAFSEAFRMVRTNLIFSVAAEGARVVTVTSSGPGEGKTVVATNVSVGLAQMGLRVLLIDADMRRPRVHQVFEQESEPGLSNLMIGAKASEVIRKTSVPGLWLLPSGHAPPNPAELLGFHRFRDFLGTLSTHFDWVIIDTPPVMAVTDAAIIAHETIGVLFVVGSEMTTRGTARTAIERLHAARATVIGTVLNRVDLRRNSYYYSQYYRKEYTRYYTRA